MDDVLGYAGKRVIVSGASTAVGLATTRLLVDLGAEVHALGALRPDATGLASFTEVDLGDDAQVAAAVKRIGAVVNALFHCADEEPDALVECVVQLMLVPGAAIASIAPTGVTPTGEVTVRLNTVVGAVDDPTDAAEVAWPLVLLNSPRARAVAGATLPLTSEPA